MSDIFQNAINDLKKTGDIDEIANEKSSMQKLNEEFSSPEDLSNKIKDIERKSRKSYPMPQQNWKNIPLEDLPSKGLFYPEGTQLTIRSASSREIRHFSTIDDKDILNVDDKLNYIIENCSRLKIQGKKDSNYKDILECDRTFVLLAIRELTFVQGEGQLVMNIECSNCGNTDQINIDKNQISDINFDEKLMKYYNRSKSCFEIKMKDGSQFDLYVPTLGLTDFVKNYARLKQYQNQYIDESFLKLILYITKDYRTLNDKTFRDMSIESLKWDPVRISVLNQLITLIDNSILTQIDHTCSACGTEGKHLISFQEGIKGLFLLTDVFDYLA